MTKAWMIFSQALMVLSLLAWGMALIMSPMAFDSGPSRAATIFIAMLLAYPAMLAVCALLSWRSYARGGYLLAAFWTSVPILVVTAGGIALQIHG